MGIKLRYKTLPDGKKKLISPHYYYTFKLPGVDQFRGTTRTSDKKLAIRIYEKKKREAEERILFGASVRWKVRELIDWCWKYHWSRKPRMSKERIEQQIAAFLRLFGSLVAAEITHQRLLDYRFEREKKVSIQTTSREFTPLRFAWKKAIEAGLLRTSPFVGIKQAKVRRRFRTATPEEQAHLIDKARGMFRWIVRFALATGLRKGEIETLEKKAVDFDNNEIRVVSWKGQGEESHVRYVPIYPDALEVLREMWKHPYPTVFHNGIGEAIKPAGLIHSAWPRLVEKCGIEDLNFHDLRHTFATELWRKTRDILLVHKVLGHEKMDTTLTYLNLRKTDLAYQPGSTLPLVQKTISMEVVDNHSSAVSSVG